jgi:hypothetical protein
VIEAFDTSDGSSRDYLVFDDELERHRQLIDLIPEDDDRFGDIELFNKL